MELNFKQKKEKYMAKKTTKNKLLYELIIGIVFIILSITSYYYNNGNLTYDTTNANVVEDNIILAEETKNVELTRR